MSTLIGPDAAYLALVFLLFVAPKFLQRFGIPSAVTALAFGAGAGMGLGVSHTDQTVHLLSMLGIVALFLFAGLDVEVPGLRQEARTLVEHVVVQGLMLVPVALLAAAIFGLPLRPGFLVSLAVLTPSTGFILDSLSRWGLSKREQFWIRSKAIATELVALAVLFIVLQSTSYTRLGLSSVALVAMVAILPAAFRWFASAVVPHAPRSEFGFLMMVAAACAMLTRSLGVYYLVGAFVVGMTAQQFRNSLPALSSERMLGAIESFASLFVPFYFFHAGLELVAADFGWRAAIAGAGFVIVGLPIRLLLVGGHRAFRFGEYVSESIRIGIPLLPTTVFTLVMVDILREQFAPPSYLLGGLVYYMLATTLLPSVVLKGPTPGLDEQ